MTPELAAAMREMRVNSLQWEREITRKVVAAIPEGGDWRPDPKAKTAFELAWHIVASEVQMLDEIADMKFSMDEKFAQPKTLQELLAFYDEQFPRALARVQALAPEQLATAVDFYGAFQLPAVAYTGFVESHSIHHRGQLSTYLRPMGSKVPSIYGGSADEPWQPPQ